MPKSEFTEVPLPMEWIAKYPVFCKFLTDFFHHVYGLGVDVTGSLDKDNLSAESPSLVDAETVTGLWTFSTHPLGLDHTKLSNIGTKTHPQVDTHIASTSNPHSVTKAQIGLGNVDNVSEATIIADTKADADVADALAKKHTQGTDTALGAVGTKNPPIDADKAIYRDSTASDALVTSTWTQVKAFLKTYWDTLYEALANKNVASGYAGLNASSRTTKGVDTTDDLIVDVATKGLVLKDTQATPHYWRATVSTTGVLTTADLGTVKP